MTENQNDWQAKARARVADLLAAGQALALWETLRNPDNRVSRQAVRDLEPGAPAVTATIKAWQEWLAGRFPDFTEKRAEQQAKAQAESDAFSAKWQTDQELHLAKSGPQFRRGQTIHPNALEYCRAMLAEGFTARRSGIGLLAFVHPDGRETKAFRNKHVNAAMRLLERGAA